MNQLRFALNQHKALEKKNRTQDSPVHHLEFLGINKCRKRIGTYQSAPRLPWNHHQKLGKFQLKFYKSLINYLMLIVQSITF